jgi:large subunit ribosomal protein L21
VFAVVSSGGKQYRVEPGATLRVERIDAEPGSSVTLDRVLVVGDGDEVRVGDPLVSGASVRATVLGEVLGDKIVVFKYKPKVKYRRRTGHRQRYTALRVEEITGAGDKPRPAARASGRRKAAPAKEPADGA